MCLKNLSWMLQDLIGPWTPFPMNGILGNNFIAYKNPCLSALLLWICFGERKNWNFDQSTNVSLHFHLSSDSIAESRYITNCDFELQIRYDIGGIERNCILHLRNYVLILNNWGPATLLYFLPTGSKCDAILVITMTNIFLARYSTPRSFSSHLAKVRAFSFHLILRVFIAFI